MMTITELVARAAAQPVVTVNREISFSDPVLQEAMRSRPYMSVAELIAHPDRRKEMRSFRYGHVLGPGLSQAAISRWQHAFPLHRLPTDVADALGTVNGVHLWADLDVGRSYFGIAPLEEWRDIAGLEWMLGRRESCLVISYHENGDYVLVLDTEARRFDWVDHEDIDNPLVVGRTFAEMLGWLWDYAQTLDPNDERAG